MQTTLHGIVPPITTPFTPDDDIDEVALRAEGTNIFNLVNLGQPGASVPAAGTTSTTFGVITGASAMRRLQFGARLTF